MDIEYFVHGGFLKCWKIVQNDVITWLHKKEWKNVVICGYSHGGALALLAHECAWYELPHLRNEHITTIAFEAPRIYAGWRIKDEIKERWAGAYVIRNNRDIVTHMPPRALGFSDVGEIVKVSNLDIEKIGCVKSHTPKWICKALLSRKNKSTLAFLEEKLKTTDLWK